MKKKSRKKREMKEIRDFDIGEGNDGGDEKENFVGF